ncbi:hypothetical protein ACQ4PT_070852 [Festuca glaucescens]
MAASRSSPASSWPDLPAELLGLVLSRLPCHRDRVRLRAVCRQWRSSARLQPLPPPLPWVALPDGSFLVLPNGGVHRALLPDDVSERLPVGSLLFVVHRGDTCCLTNVCSAATTPLLEIGFCFQKNRSVCEKAPPPPAPVFTKLVVSDQIVAALTKSKHVAVSTRLPQEASCSNIVWAPERSDPMDIAMFDGKLYVLTMEENGQRELHVLQFCDEGSSTVLQFQQCIHSSSIEADQELPQEWFNPLSTEYYTQQLYLVASGEQLLLVKRMINLPPLCPLGESKVYRTRSFEVFQAAGLNSGFGQWIKLDTLRGHALFVSKGCCNSFPPALSGHCNATAGPQQNSIYFINERSTHVPIYESPFLDSGVYSISDHTVMALPLETTVVPKGPWCPAWLFPTDT